MDDEQIREVFFQRLKDKSPHDAAMETYQQIGEELLAQVYKDRAAEEHVWEMLLKMMRGLSLLNLYISTRETPADDAFKFEPQHFSNLITLFHTWKDALVFFAENYESLKSEKFRERFSLEKLRFFIGILDKRIAGTVEAIESTETILVVHREFHMMATAFRIAIRVTIGEEEYKKFSEQFNQSMRALEVYFLQIVAPPGGGSAKQD